MIYNESKYNAHWDTKKLNQLGTFSRGKSKHRPRNDPRLYENGRYPLIQTGDIKAANLFITTHSQEYGDFGLQQSKLWNTGTLCITIAANIAETGILAYPMCFPDSVVGFNAYADISSEFFMHYVFRYIRNAIQNSVSGSIQDNINIEYLSNLDFKVPDKPYQDKIVYVLSSIDKKIELNNRIIAELETMAKTIYDYWFVQFNFPNAEGKPYRFSGGEMVWNEQLKREIPKGWGVNPLPRHCQIIDCLHSEKPSLVFENEDYYLLQLDNLIDNGLISLANKYYVSKEMYELWTSRIEVVEGDLVITNAGRVGAIARIPKHVKAGIGRNMTAIRPNDVPACFLYYFFTSSDIARQIKMNTDLGSFFRSLNVRGIKELKIILPPKNMYAILNKFEDYVSPLRSKIELLAQENLELTKLRDWLLPMLMNGQVNVE